VLGLVTAASIVGLVVAGVNDAPPPVLLLLLAMAGISGPGAMALGAACLLPGRNPSRKARRQAFVGAALGSLVLVGLALLAASVVTVDSQANAALTRIAAHLQKSLQAEQRCVNAAQSSGASPQAAFNRCATSSATCSSAPSIRSEAVFYTTGASDGIATNVQWRAALVLLLWAGLVFAAGWLLFRPRDPPPLAGAAP